MESSSDTPDARRIERTKSAIDEVLKAEPTDYVLLRELTTKPRTSYLGRITNPNPALADGGAK